MAKTVNPIVKKAGPLPVWAWAVGGVVMFWIVKRFSSGSSSAAQAAPSSFGTGTNPVGVPTGGGAPASGQGSAIDNNTAGLLASLFGNSVQINSNLVTGLLGATSSIEGLGSEALRQNGATEQAIINGKFWGNAPTVVVYSGPGGGATTTTTSSTTPWTPATTPATSTQQYVGDGNPSNIHRPGLQL